MKRQANVPAFLLEYAVGGEQTLDGHAKTWPLWTSAIGRHGLTAITRYDASTGIQTAPAGVRLRALDAVRGLALFGVLAVNLDSEFRVSLFEQFQPAGLASASTVDQSVSALLTTVVEFKAFAIFSMLFGVGLAMQFERLPEGVRFQIMVRRLLVLLLVGLIHLTLIWNGDILTEYALAGLLVLPFFFRSRRVAALAAIGALLIYLAMPWIPLPFSFPSPDWINAHVRAARAAYGDGSFSEILAFRLRELPQIAKLHTYVFPRTVALMLFGTLIWRSGVLRPGSGARVTILTAAVVTLGVGFILSLLSSSLPGAWGFSISDPTATVSANAAPVFLAAGYAAAIWSVSTTRLRPFVDWAAPAGQMAFTNYLVQSIILGLLFYGYGAGLMGKIGVAAGLILSAVLFIAQVLFSSWWLRSHRYGPLEWAWRSLTYGSLQPWKRTVCALDP